MQYINLLDAKGMLGKITNGICLRRGHNNERKARASALALYYINLSKKNGEFKKPGYEKEMNENRQALLGLCRAPYPQLLTGEDAKMHLWICILYETWHLSIVCDKPQNGTLIDYLQGLGFEIPEQYIDVGNWPREWLYWLYRRSIKELGLPDENQFSNNEFNLNCNPNGSGNNGHGVNSSGEIRNTLPQHEVIQISNEIEP